MVSCETQSNPGEKGIHTMTSKNKTEVLIDGKIYTLSGYESEDYLQRVAAYINNKLTELKKLNGFSRQPAEVRDMMVELNIADDYFKAKKQIDVVEEELSRKEKELYDLKHTLIEVQIQLENAKQELEKAHRESKRG